MGCPLDSAIRDDPKDKPHSGAKSSAIELM